jgi:phospholipid/cholesterol/gamma-HCH transport system permease protein
MLDFFSLVSIERLAGQVDRKPVSEGLLTWVGGRVEPLFQSLGWVLGTSLDAAAGAFLWPFRGRSWRWDRIGLEVEAAVLGALPIVLLIGFLLGLILAMQAFVQLRVWGADVYMANMVGVSVVYEIGPLMTGIILAARSGSSNAAQLGSMVVAEEIDALLQMGIHPVRYLVVPKVLALSFAVVALGIVFDCIAIIGGACFGYFAAGIDANVYMERTAEALALNSFMIACAKCCAFGGLIGVVGCGLGLRVSGGSQGVGRATTNTVVLAIFLIIVVDAIFVAVQQMWPA